MITPQLMSTTYKVNLWSNKDKVVPTNLSMSSYDCKELYEWAFTLSEKKVINSVWDYKMKCCIFTPLPLKTVGYCFHQRCPDGRVGGGKKFVWAVSQKL